MASAPAGGHEKKKNSALVVALFPYKPRYPPILLFRALPFLFYIALDVRGGQSRAGVDRVPPVRSALPSPAGVRDRAGVPRGEALVQSGADQPQRGECGRRVQVGCDVMRRNDIFHRLRAGSIVSSWGRLISKSCVVSPWCYAAAGPRSTIYIYDLHLRSLRRRFFTCVYFIVEVMQITLD